MSDDTWYDGDIAQDDEMPPEIDTTVPHIARIYDYWLGGKDNFEVDRVAGERAAQADPSVLEGVRGNRAFLRRSVEFLAREAGIGQFLDVGTGIPAANNTHEVAQALNPDARVVYVDNDPIVLAHARALLTGKLGMTAYVDADARDPGLILQAAARTLDFDRPVGVMLVGVLHCIPDDDDPWAIARELMGAMPSGSFLTISHPSTDFYREATGSLVSGLNSAMRQQLTFRIRDDVARFFDGLELVEPGLVRAPDWRPASEAERENPAALWAGVARKP